MAAMLLVAAGAAVTVETGPRVAALGIFGFLRRGNAEPVDDAATIRDAEQQSSTASDNAPDFLAEAWADIDLVRGSPPVNRPTPVRRARDIKAMATEPEVTALDEFLIKWGFKEDPRIPEDCREDMMTRIKKSGRAGIAAYAMTEAGFWLLSIPLAILAVSVTQGGLPDMNSDAGKAAVGGYSLAFLTFARTIVPARIALALGLAPWVDDNVIQKFFPDDPAKEDCELPPAPAGVEMQSVQVPDVDATRDDAGSVPRWKPPWFPGPSKASGGGGPQF
jgi:hypothetical protein